ncbi:DUF4179 domain-containing protein [Cytobacillus praedii]|uniref:DUF4179 domain-containing protein n=1 Tax=Cytobacillus praedii TaxID=1742358 RepID=UPI003AF57DAF
MNEPLKIKKLLSEDEKQKLKFTDADKNAVFRKIQDSNSQIGSNRVRVKTVVLKALIPVAAILIIFSVLIQTPIKKHVLAAIPILNSLFSEYGDEGQKEAAQKEIVKPINHVVEDNGVKITFKEILYDGARISVAYTIEATDGKFKGENLDILFFNMKVDGKDINTSFGFSGGQNDKKIGNKYLKVQNIDIDQALPNEFTLNLMIQELILVDSQKSNQKIKGNWSFSLPVKKAGETYVYTPTVSKKTDFGEFRVKKIVFAPSGTQMEIEYKRPMEFVQNDSQILFRVLDPNNKEIKAVNEGQNTFFRYKNGIQIGSTSIILRPTKEIPEFITIEPYYEASFGPIVHVKNITEKLPILLPQGQNSGIVIKKIEKKPGEVWVHLDVTGDNFIRERKNQFQLVKGKEFTQKSFKAKEGDDLKSDESKNQIIKFKTSYSKNLNFISDEFNLDEFIDPEITDKWKMKIPINKKDLKILE